jgi:hypothetical protein
VAGVPVSNPALGGTISHLFTVTTSDTIVTRGITTKTHDFIFYFLKEKININIVGLLKKGT